MEQETSTLSQKSAASMRITDSKQAAFLTHIDNLVFLEPFMGTEISVSDAAAKANVGTQQMFYQVAKMVQLGLLQNTKSEKRNGKQIKLFQATSEQYFVPLAVSPLVNLAACFRSTSTVMLEEQCLFQARTLLKNKADSDYGFKIEKIGSDVNFNLAELDAGTDSQNSSKKTDIAALPMVMGFGRFRISRKKAEALRQLMRQLDEVEEDEVGDFYIYRIALTPEIQ